MDLQVLDWGLPGDSRLDLRPVAKQPAPEPSLEVVRVAQEPVQNLQPEAMGAQMLVARLELRPVLLRLPPRNNLAVLALGQNFESPGDGSRPLRGQAPVLAHG